MKFKHGDLIVDDNFAYDLVFYYWNRDYLPEKEEWPFRGIIPIKQDSLNRDLVGWRHAEPEEIARILAYVITI